MERRGRKRLVLAFPVTNLRPPADACYRWTYSTRPWGEGKRREKMKEVRRWLVGSGRPGFGLVPGAKPWGVAMTND